MLGFLTRRGKFRRAVERFAASIGFEPDWANDELAVLGASIDGVWRTIAVGLMDDGQVMLNVMTASYWEGREPAAAHVLAEKFDADSRHVSWKVKHYRHNGRTRISGTALLPSADLIGGDGFAALAKDMLASAMAADSMLEKNGYV